MVRLRPYVVAVNHVPGCPRLESGQGGRKQGRRRCAPGCTRETDGWEVDLALRLPDGTPIRERVKAPVSGRSAALRWAQEREGQILAQKGRKPRQARQVPTVAEFKPRFIEGHVKANRLKPSSAEAYESIFRTHLEPEFGTMRLDAIGDERVQRFKGEVAFYDFAEYRRLVEAAAAIDPRIEPLVLLGGDAGLRRGEAIALEWTDVDLRRRTMHVQRSSWNGQATLPKGGRTRRLPLTERLAHALQAHRHLKGPRVLYYDDGAPPTNKEIRIWMERAQRRAVLPANGGYHILRHTFCSHLAMQGATAKATQELAGHQDLTTTQRYMHLSPAHKNAAIRLLDRRPVEAELGAPFDSAPPSAGLRSGRAEGEGTASSAVRAISVGDGLETSLRPEPESSRSE